jgi:insulysin
MTKEYENFKFLQSYQQTLYYCSLLLEEHAWPWEEELAALSHLEVSDVGKFLTHLLAKTFIESYFAGLYYNCLNYYFFSNVQNRA